MDDFTVLQPLATNCSFQDLILCYGIVTKISKDIIYNHISNPKPLYHIFYDKVMLLTYRYPGSSVVLSRACRGKTHDPFWAALASPLSGGDLGWSSLLVDALHNNQKFSRYKESTMCVSVPTVYS